MRDSSEEGPFKRGWMRSATESPPLVVGVIVALGFLFLQATVVGVQPGRVHLQLLLAATTLFAAVTIAVRVGGARALVWLWFLMALFWALQLYFAAPLDGPIRAPGQQLLARGLGVPVSFVAWSAIGLPLFVASYVLLVVHRRNGLRSHLVIPALVWLVLFAVARYLRTIPWDLDPTPLTPTIAAWGMTLVFGPIPFGVVGWMLVRVRKTVVSAINHPKPV